MIDPRGGKLANYRNNPAVLWEHGKDPRRFTDPIGRNMWIKHNGGQRPTQLLARTQFLDGVSALVDKEDYVAGRAIQRGLASGAQPELLFGRNEPAMIHYHQSMRATLGSPLPSEVREAAE